MLGRVAEPCPAAGPGAPSGRRGRALERSLTATSTRRRPGDGRLGDRRRARRRRGGGSAARPADRPSRLRPARAASGRARSSSRRATRARRPRRCPGSRAARAARPAARRRSPPAGRSRRRPTEAGAPVPALPARRSAARRHRLRRRARPRAAVGRRRSSTSRIRSAPVVASLESPARAAGALGRDRREPRQAAGVVDVRPHPGRLRPRHRWPRSRTAGRRSSTRTPRPGRSGSRCPRPTTTRSRAASTRASCRTHSTSSQLRDPDEPRRDRRALSRRRGAPRRARHEPLDGLGRGSVTAGAGARRGRARRHAVSVYLAILYQTDPTPVTLLAMLKQRLARATGSEPTARRGAT